MIKASIAAVAGGGLLAILSLILLPASALAADPDLSSPKAAAKSLLLAVDSGDAPALKQIFEPGTDSQADYIAAVADMMVAAKKLGDAATARFGAAGEGLARGMIDRQDVKQVDSAEVAQSGNSATVTLRGQNIPMKFRLINGVWRLVVIDPASATDLPRKQQLCRGLVGLFDQFAADITAGKFPTAPDAEQALSQRMHLLMIASTNSTTRPTTQP